MNDSPQSESSHEDKINFSSKKEAEAAAIVARNQYGHNRRLKAYLCRECDLWHLASDY